MTLATIAAGINALHARLERLERAMVLGRGDDDQWTRIPSRGGRCPVSNWGRTTISNLIKSGTVRTKIVRGCRFYAAADVRAILDQTKPAKTP